MVAALAGFAAAACGDDADPQPTQSPTTATVSPTKTQTTTTASSTPTTAAPGQTGNVAFDRIIGLVKAGDAAALVKAIHYHEIACIATPLGMGAPPLCQAGEAAGTRVKVFIRVACEYEYVRPNNVQAVIEDPLLKNSTPLIYAVFKVKDGFPPEFPLGSYAVLFSIDTASGPAGVAVGMTAEGKVTSIYRGCQRDAKSIYEQLRGSEVLVAPPAP